MKVFLIYWKRTRENGEWDDVVAGFAEAEIRLTPTLIKIEKAKVTWGKQSGVYVKAYKRKTGQQYPNPGWMGVMWRWRLADGEGERIARGEVR